MIENVDERIEKLFARQGIIPAPAVAAVDPETAHTSSTVDATVREPVGLQLEPVVEIIPAAVTPRFTPGDIVIPEGATFMPPLMADRFRLEWIGYLEETGQTELILPSIADVNAWAEREYTTPEGPSPIAHLIQVSGETMAEIKARSGWHRPSDATAPAPRLGNVGPSSTFGNGR